MTEKDWKKEEKMYKRCSKCKGAGITTYPNIGCPPIPCSKCNGRGRIKNEK